MPISTAMIAITTSSSTSVKPTGRLRRMATSLGEVGYGGATFRRGYRADHVCQEQNSLVFTNGLIANLNTQVGRRRYSPTDRRRSLDPYRACGHTGSFRAVTGHDRRRR